MIDPGAPLLGFWEEFLDLRLSVTCGCGSNTQHRQEK